MTCLMGTDTGWYDGPDPIVRYSVPLYDQKNTNMCWAYCMAMYDSWKKGESLDNGEEDRLAASIAKRYNNHIYWDFGLPFWRQGLKAQVESIEDLAYVLQNNGPVYAAYQDENDYFGGHIVLVTGVNLITKKVYTNNPWNIQGEQTFELFLHGFLKSETETIDGYYLYGVYIAWP